MIPYGVVGTIFLGGEIIAVTIDNLQITASGNARSAIASLDRIIQRLERIQQLATNVSASFAGMGSNVTFVTNTTNNYNRTLNQTNKQLSQHIAHHRSLVHRLATTVGQMYILFMAAKKVANIFAEWYKKSNDFIENMNLFEVTMRDNTDAALEYAESVERIMGIDLSDWLSYQGKFQQLSKGFGVASDAANVMSQNLTQLSYDLSSFFNVDVEKAFQKLSSAMAGQVKGLREYGIDVSNASLQQYALSKGIDLTVREMNQAQKSVLRYNYILEKSVNIQGDMARTIATPSNALRILNAQMEKLRRTLGNIVSVVVTKFIPYIQAAVMLLSDFADSIAKKWGFELPKIDYSGLDDAVSVEEDLNDYAEDISDNFADATQEVKKFKNQLMGFDELNILKAPTDDAASKVKTPDIKNLYPNDLGLGIPSYDFGLDDITPQAKQIYQRFKRWLADLSPKKLFTEFTKGLQNIWKWFNKLDTSTKILIGGIAAAFAITQLVKFVTWGKRGVTTIADFLLGIRNAEGAMGSLKRAGVVAAGTIAAAFAGFDFFSSLVQQTTDWKNVLVDSALAIGGIAAAFAVGGWVGAAVAGLGLIVGGIAGVVNGMNELQQSRAMQDFVVENGVTFTELTDAFVGITDNIQAMYDKYNEVFVEMANNKSDIDTTVENIGKIGSRMLFNVTDVQQGSKEIQEELAKLNSGIATQTQLIYDSIYTAIGGAFGDAARDAGISTDKVLELTALTTAGMNREAAEVIKNATELTQKLENGQITVEEYTSKWAEYQEKLAKITGDTDTVTTATDNLRTALGRIGDINWEDEEKRSAALDKVKTSASNAKNSINDYYDNLGSTLTRLRDQWGKGTEQYNFFNGLLDTSETARKKSLDEVNTLVNNFFNDVQADIGIKIGNLQDKIQKEWDSFGDVSWEHFVYGTVFNYAKGRVEAETGFVSNISDDLQSAMDEIGTNGKAYAGKALEKTLSGLTYDHGDVNVPSSGVGIRFNQLSESWNKNFRELAGENVASYDNAVKRKLQESSGLDKAEWESKAKGIVDTFNKQFSMLTIPKLQAEIAYNYDIPQPDKKVYQSVYGIMGKPSVNFKTYAQGGFPETGEMFIARESGAEMVGTIGNHTAVANNDQIVTAIEAAVFRAMSQLRNNNSTTVNATLEIDGEAMARKTFTVHNDEVLRTGASPLLI